MERIPHANGSDGVVGIPGASQLYSEQPELRSVTNCRLALEQN